jgi:hypothetical protein
MKTCRPCRLAINLTATAAAIERLGMTARPELLSVLARELELAREIAGPGGVVAILDGDEILVVDA